MPVAFNALGPRDSERPAPGAVRLLVVGDSGNFGQGLPQDEIYPSQTEKLRTRRLGAPVEVLNMGVSGYNTLHHLAQLREVRARARIVFSKPW